MIECQNAGFRYAEDWIFRAHNFRVETADIVAVIGPNGRGKTTLLKIITGLLQPNEGNIHVQGNVGYVPQNAQSAFPYSVLDMVVMGRARHIGLFSVPGKHDFEIAHKMIDHLGLKSYEDRPFDRLSGGERQLVLMARALASECDVLVLDEPASALDFYNQNIILRTLRDVAKNHGLTVLLTTHYPQHAIHLADKVLLMHSANHFQFGTTADVMTDVNLEQLYSMPIRNVSIDHEGRVVTTTVPIFS